MPTPILFVSHQTAMGGAEIALVMLLRHLDPNRWELHLACNLDDQCPWPHQTKSLKIQLHHVALPRLLGSPLAPIRWRKGARQLAKLARKINARALFSNAVRSSIYTAHASSLTHIPFIWQMQEPWVTGKQPSTLWLDRRVKRFLTKRAFRVIAVSDFVAQQLPADHKIIVIHNAIEGTEKTFSAAPSHTEFRNTFGIPKDAPFVSTVNRLVPIKGQDRFLRMMATVKREIPEAWFGVIGGSIFRPDHPYPQKLKQLAQELKIDGCTVFTGQLEDPGPAFQATDVFVHPGDPEAFGLVNIEAMARGKPVVSFAHGAQPEIIADGQTGIMVKPLDEPALSAAVVRLLKQPALAQQMGEAGRVRVKKHFITEVQFPKIEEILLSASRSMDRIPD